MHARVRLFLLALPSALLAMLSPTATAAPTSTAPSYAYVGGGCFWCTEAAYELLPGVISVVSGYAGGQIPNPTYKQITTGTTGHAEIIRIEFDPAVVSYRAVLDFFWAIHDPTTLNRQGADEGTQYRSIILTTFDGERTTAEASRAAAQPGWGNRIVTEIVPLERFYEAEEYHQDYFRKNPNAGYCRVVIKPKLDKLKKHPGGAVPSAKAKP
jgi:peptide-methionine (S)-S-oxide reductase